MTDAQNLPDETRLLHISPLGFPISKQSLTIVCTAGGMHLNQNGQVIGLTRYQAIGLKEEIERRLKEDWS